MSPVGLLLSNLGSPAAPRRREVAAYLRQFLTDPRVLDIPVVPRQLLVRGIIAPFRASRSARAYAKVWTPDGSPLVVHSRKLATKVAAKLGTGWKVALGMRYGNPSIESALDELVRAGCRRIVTFPLYPQYASATTGSTLEEVWRAASRAQVVPEIVPVSPFFRHPGFLGAFERRIRRVLQDHPQAHLVFSFHGLPERQVLKADPSGTCLTGECCLREESLATCYKAQCLATARALADRLELPTDRWTVAFQSRLGRIPWLGPSTTGTVDHLIDRGAREIVVAAPAFVADCLETLEELGMALSDSAKARGAGLWTVPCPNDGDDWAESVATIALSYLPPSP